MAEIIQRYRMLIIAIGLLMLAGLIWLIASRQNLNRIPSRGVLVYGAEIFICPIRRFI